MVVHIILTLGGLGQEDLKSEASLGYVVRPCLRNSTTTKKQSNIYQLMDG
jgi:hypothetical protein